MAQPVVADKIEASLWPFLLVVVSAVATVGFACVTPFAAFAVAAAYVLPARPALLAIAAVWLANQAVGFAFMDYPWTAESIGWGIAIGAAALAATATASFVFDRATGLGIVATLGVALVAAFCVYEVLLLICTPVLGSLEAFTPSIVGQFALLNLAWAAALIGALEAWRAAKPWAMRHAGGRTA
jgi:hypothetical protein